MLSASKKSVLLPTPTKTDVQHSGGYLNVTGFQWKIKSSDVLNMRQINYKAEVPQAYTVGASGYTPTASTTYTLRVGNPFRRYQGWAQGLMPVSYTTPANLLSIGANDAARRLYIHTQLAAAINKIDYLFITATLSGNNLVLTDKAGYNPFPTAGGVTPRRGKSTIQVVTNLTGSGFAAADLVLTTAGVYSFGDGTYMATMAPVFYAYFGNNLIGGSLDCPISITGAVPLAGQKYNAFLISYLYRRPVPTVSDVDGFEQREVAVFADNGQGTVTTPRAGYITFERLMRKELFGSYKTDPSAIIEFFDQNFVIQGNLGGLPATTTATNGSLAVYNKFLTPYGELDHRNIGTQTIVAPTQGPSGLLTDQDLTTGDGAHYTPSLVTVNSQEFVVGKTEMSVVAKWTVADVTGANFLVGFHEKNVFYQNFNDYNDLAAIGTNNTAGAIVTNGILTNLATVTTVSAILTANGVESEFIVKVDINGVATTICNDVEFPVYSAVGIPMVFAAGTVLVPFFEHTLITGKTAVGNISQFVAVPSLGWKE